VAKAFTGEIAKLAKTKTGKGTSPTRADRTAFEAEAFAAMVRFV
jgi:hypothetical protein